MIRVIAGERRSPSGNRRRRSLALGLLLSFVLAPIPPCAGQEVARALPVSSAAAANGGVKTANEPAARPAPPDSQPCDSSANQAGFLYPKIPVSFVGGTIAGMPMVKGKLHRFNPFQPDQFRVNGSLAIGSCNMVFTFAADKDRPPAVEPDASFQVLPCGAGVGAGLSSEGARICNSGEKSAGGKPQYAIQIPFGQINVLARGRKGPGELNSDTATYLTAATAIVTTILATVSNTRDKELAFGATVLVMSAAYFFLIRRPSQAENYVAVFVRKAASERKAAAAENLLTEKPKAPEGELLQRGDVVIFRIKNYHDYFNVSMILSGKTGLTFVSQSAEKGK